MPSPRSAALRGLFAFALASTASIELTLREAGATPVIARPAVTAVTAPVTVAEDADSFTLANGLVTARISKRNGNLTSLLFHGVETMAGGGYWETAPQAPKSAVTLDPAKSGGERAEVSIKGTPSGRGIDIELRYALARGVSGIYAYGIYNHPAANPAAGYGENRYITKLSHTFNWISVDADRNMLECTPEDWGAGVVVHAKEQRILGTGYYKNSVEHKYSYNAVQYRTPAYGWSSTKDHIGVWFINPTTEYLCGGAEKLELVAHYDDRESPDPIILDYWCGGHYAGGASCRIPAGEEWNKVVGPIFVYCNALADPKAPTPADLATLEATAGNPSVPPACRDNATMLFQDALAQAKVEKANWPYDWVNGVDYPHKSERGTVAGQLLLNDPQAVSKKLPRLTVGLAHPDYPGGSPRAGNNGIVTWPHDGNYYQFWTDGTEDGKFTITNVRPGTYTLHAFADGVLGEFAQTNITVAAGKSIDLGQLVWKPVRYGKQLWEIGYPTRTGDKFFKGDAANYWLWGWGLRYPLLFPNDITYTVGKSDYHKDWFFQQTPHSETTAWLNPDAKDPANQRFGWMKFPVGKEDIWRAIGHGRATTWTIKFNLPQAAHGQAALRVALAGSDGTAGLAGPGAPGGLAVGVNGESVGSIHLISTNALRYNTNKGVWRDYTLTFDAARLKAGENSIELTVPAGELTSGVVYDYLRLEFDENQKFAGKPVALVN